MASTVEKALRLIKDMPRVCMGNIKDMPGSRLKPARRRNLKRGGKHGRKKKGQAHKGTLPPLGHEGFQFPFYLRVPREPYYHGHMHRKQYPPITLLQLQRLIDLGRIDPSEPIDLTSLCNTGLFWVDVKNKHYGFNLKDEGVDLFAVQVNIEVQWTNELCIAAIERNGGVITTRYYDPPCLYAKRDTERFFERGLPIPRCKLPSQDVLQYYTEAQNRGYLADPKDVEDARLELAQKYGYILPDLSKDPMSGVLLRRKDPIHIFHGLDPGWVVNLKDKQILKPIDPDVVRYYSADQ